MGRSHVEIRGPNGEKAIPGYAEVTGRDLETIMQGQENNAFPWNRDDDLWQTKGTPEGMITPADIRRYIETNLL